MCLAIVIKFCILFQNCKSVESFKKSAYSNILNEEIKLQRDYFGTKNFGINYEFIQNDEFNNFILTRVNDPKQYLEDFYPDENTALFDIDEGKTLLKQLENQSSLIQVIPKEYKSQMEDFEALQKKIMNNSNESIRYHSLLKLFLGQPIISKNRKYALIYYYRGSEMEFESGIHLYENKNNNWVLGKEIGLAF